MQKPRVRAREDLLGNLDNGALDAAAGDGAHDVALTADRHLRARRQWRRLARIDDGREGDLVAVLGPFMCLRQNVAHPDSSSRATSSALLTDRTVRLTLPSMMRPDLARRADAL